MRARWDGDGFALVVALTGGDGNDVTRLPPSLGVVRRVSVPGRAGAALEIIPATSGSPRAVMAAALVSIM